MQFRRSAGIYVAGVCLFLGGPLVTFIASIYWTTVMARGSDQGLATILVGVMFSGGLMGVVGFFMLIVAAHRALVKIDALQVPAPAAASGYSQDSWPEQDEQWTQEQR